MSDQMKGWSLRRHKHTTAGSSHKCGVPLNGPSAGQDGDQQLLASLTSRRWQTTVSPPDALQLQ